MHEDFGRRHEIKTASDRSFGLVMAAALVVVAIAPLRHGLSPRWWSLAVAAVFTTFALAAPGALRPLNVVWTKLGLLLNRVTSPVLLALVFGLAIVPTGVIMRAFGRDPMRRKREPAAKSYWIVRKVGPGAMTRQF